MQSRPSRRIAPVHLSAVGEVAVCALHRGDVAARLPSAHHKRRRHKKRGGGECKARKSGLRGGDQHVFRKLVVKQRFVKAQDVWPQ